MSAAVIGAQKPAQPAAGSKDNAGTVTYIGCLEPGGTAGHYLLLSAEEKGAKGKEKASFNVVAASAKLAMEANVTKAVEITGTLSAPAVAASPKDGATALPTLTATGIKFRADYCGVPVPN
jgi:hypothetical protein